MPKSQRPTERSDGGSEQTFGSTRWEFRRVKIARPPEAMAAQRPTGLRWRKLPRTNWRKPTHITISYRGGPEGWVEVHARGDLGRYPGSTAIIDVLADITHNR